MRARTILFITFLAIIAPLFQSFAQDANPEKLILEGVELHDEGKYKEAVEKYTEALKIDSTSQQATYELSLSYLALKDFQNASLFSTAVIQSGNKLLSTGAYAVKSEALVGLNKVDEAIALLQEGLIKNGDEFLLHFNLALNFYKKENIEKTLVHVKKAIDLNKSQSGAFLLYAHALEDTGLWVQSILAFQMFLLLEPDSKRSKIAFEEMLGVMRIKSSEETEHKSFVELQTKRNTTTSTDQAGEIPPLTIAEDLNRKTVYDAITHKLDSLKNIPEGTDDFVHFKVVNQTIMEVLSNESKGIKDGVFWTFYVPFFTHITNSEYYDTFCRYISVSYFPESYEWWQENPADAINFVIWFEKGDEE